MGDTRQLDPTILREYDIRGIIGDSFNAAEYRSIGRAFGSVVREHSNSDKTPVVAVGYDGRLSSPELSDALCAGLTASGVNVINVGCGPTPMLYFATHELETDGGMMITGSHNPPDYNGIKMVLDGHSFFGDDIQALGACVAEGNFTEGEGALREHSVFARYIERILEDFAPGTELSVAWDPGNGASGEVVAELVKSLPGQHFLINEEIDGTFPAHHPDPTVEKNLVQLKELVAEKGCDLGVGFDGDGDRIGVVDAEGRVLWGDQLMIVLAREVLKDNPGAPIITEVKASKAFFDEVAKAGGTPVMWAAGHSLIKSKMAEMQAPLAGEMSGHIFFADKYFGYDDAIYTTVRLLSILANTDQSVADMQNALPKFMNTPELRFECSEDRKFKVIEEVKARLADAPDIKVHDMDGVRVETKDGWWLLRASNTQAVLVARCESSDEAGLSRLKDAVREQLVASDIEPPADFN
ncbi:MAG: phosphomannomutase/phosphoglucomutase [Rhodospirillaceae bacterium]|nr:phosphomannomutase/phosphoglucomutase [Rhodospirillaceae bacterium]